MKSQTYYLETARTAAADETKLVKKISARFKQGKKKMQLNRFIIRFHKPYHF